ncbi:MAG: DUF3616 domain-containing protein [Planctomycetota bacterium]|jgi:hypothetical protein
MRGIGKVLFSIWVCWAASFGAGGGSPEGEGLVFRGASDASAGVAISSDMVVVADDEDNLLRVYEVGTGGMPVFSYDLTVFLGIEPEHPEADIEGATMIGSRIYWITSHGRNRDGKMRPNRYRFFATVVHIAYGNVAMRRVGSPSTTLVHELLKIPSARRLGLDRATRFGEDLKKKEREKLAPKEDGLNIEALCGSPDGETIYIGFRNPGVGTSSRAIVVPLLNADGIVEWGEASVFGEPLLWDLAGLGIRSMEYSRSHGAYFIIAGSSDEDDEFALYRWSGQPNAPPVLVQELSSDGAKFKPEAMVPFEDGRLLMLSDDGSLPIMVSSPGDCLEGEYRDDGTCLNKYLRNPEKKTFRGIWLELSGP